MLSTGLRSKLIALPVTLIGVSILCFLVMPLAAPDPVSARSGKWAQTEEQKRMLVERLHLDESLATQYFEYMKGALTGDFGESWATGRDVASDLGKCFPATIELAVCATFIAIILGVIAGVLSAAYRGGLPDIVSMLIALIGVSLPIFWLAVIFKNSFAGRGMIGQRIVLMLVLLASIVLAGVCYLEAKKRRGRITKFALILGSIAIVFVGLYVGISYQGAISDAIGLSNWRLPSQGRTDIRTFFPEGFRVTGFLTVDSIIAGRSDIFFDAIRHLILPSIALATIPMAVIARLTRSSMIEVIGQDYITSARAKGLSRFKVITKHALKNTLLPVITISGTQFGYLLGGAVLTETIFSWPGLGQFTVDAVLGSDYECVRAGVLLMATSFVVVNAIVDVSYSLVDPRQRK
ncbi:MAG: ABC transporter permease [Planctomycetes bacterium]|nr:ABC transporter permease [Planctomycetota bacterium]